MTDFTTEYMKYLMYILLWLFLLFIPFIISFLYGNRSHNKYEEENDEIDESTTLNLNNFICGNCKGTFTDPRPLSEIPIKPVGSITVCHVCRYGELRNEELSKIFPNRRPMTPIHVHTGGKGIWQRKAEIESIKLHANQHKKDITKLRKLVTEMEHYKARGYTL